jgi:hypothetical protein
MQSHAIAPIRDRQAIDEREDEVVVTGVHLTFENMFFLTLMFTISQAIIGAVILVVLWWLHIIG